MLVRSSERGEEGQVVFSGAKGELEMVRELVERNFKVVSTTMTNGSTGVAIRLKNTLVHYTRGDDGAKRVGCQAYLFNNHGILELITGEVFLIEAEEIVSNDLSQGIA